MANKFSLSKKAVEDLSGILAYTIQACSETQADKYYYMHLGVCQDLADGTTAARQYPEIHPDLFGARGGQHLIFFRQIRKDTIEVIGILHSRMDLRNRMDE